jgi:hypothetical protein
MAMTVNRDSINALRRLFAVEYGSPTARLDQSMPFTPLTQTVEEHALREMARQDREHQQWLADLLNARGASPPPVSLPTNTAMMHYNRLHALLPTLIKEKRRIVEAYQAQSAKFDADPEAASIAGKILERHTQHIAALEAMKKEPAAKV